MKKDTTPFDLLRYLFSRTKMKKKNKKVKGGNGRHKFLEKYEHFKGKDQVHFLIILVISKGSGFP